MMRCNGCGDKNLVLDDSSGRYVCTSCWQVTEYFDSLTQEPSELVNLRGLRMLHPVSSASLIQATSQFSYQEVVTKTEPLPQKLQLPIKTESPSASPHSHLNGADLLKSEDLKEENAVGVRVTIKQSKLSKRKQSKRCWRLSEPFTALLRIQLQEIIRTYFKKVEKEEEDRDGDLLRETAWRLWTNYLAITGELGSRAWALAFRQVSTAGCQLLRSRQSFISSRTIPNKSNCCQDLRPPPIKQEVYPNLSHSDGCSSPQPRSLDPTMLMVNAAWLNMQFHTKNFHWAGWGQIYNPTEAAGLAFLLFGPEPESQPEFDEDSNSSDGGDGKEGEIPLKSKPVTPARRSLNGSIDPPTPVDELLSLCRINTDTASLRKYWAEMVVDKMSKKSLGEDVFWRGQVDHMGDRLLMECNLSVIFLASLLAFAKPPPKTDPDPDGPLRPTCKRGFLTLRDLQCICAEKRFPFLVAHNFIEDFPIFDQYLYVLFQRIRLPSVECIARVTVVLIHMLGIYHRPRIPLCYLVHRFLVELGLPVAVHEIANRLIAQLGHAVKQATHNSRQGLHYFLPLKRYVRGEVFAMAVVVVLVRILFKLDDFYEYRWSSVAEYLANNPAKQSLLSSLLQQPPPRKSDFMWTRWVKWVEERHCSRLQRHLRTTPRMDDPINQPLSFADLLLLQNAGEFLGSSEFVPGFDVGWGEMKAHNDYFATNEIKSNMSAPLREVLPKSNVENHHNEAVESDNRASEQCSTCRRMEIASALRPFCSAGAPCVGDQCDLLIGLRRLILSKGIAPKVFIQALFDEPSDAARTPKSVRKTARPTTAERPTND
uniref:TFIIB-type domain-containing protein n=2 Tax=Schistocephalus solidus TaxID=70667 RepID=A0A0X3NZD5_SCHSO